MPAAGCRTIAHCFNRRFAVRRQMTVGKTYVADTIRRQHYAIFCARRKLKHATPRRLPRNLIWGLDLTMNRTTQGRGTMILAIVDHGSRACLSLRSLRDKSTRTLLHGFLESCRQYGRPKYVRTDNEASLTTWPFRLWLWVLGIRHERTTPGCPWQNGRVERFFGTLKAVLDRCPVADAMQLDEALSRFRLYYNHVRPHQHLHGRTPAEVWAGVDVFADTPQGRAWQKVWAQRLDQLYQAVG
jgi:transposase InsO family protein